MKTLPAYDNTAGKREAESGGDGSATFFVSFAGPGLESNCEAQYLHCSGQNLGVVTCKIAIELLTQLSSMDT